MSPVRDLDRTWPKDRSPKAKARWTQPEWMRNLQVGDVLRAKGVGGDVFRVVRAITRHACGDLYCAQLVKRRRSGYPSPVTILYAREIFQRGFEPAGVRLKLNREADKRIACSIQRHLDCPVFLSEREAVGMP